MNGPGQLIVVGCGIQLGRHLAERCISEIRRAEVVFGLADAFALQWLQGLRPDMQNLGSFYRDDLDRRDSYRSVQQVTLGLALARYILRSVESEIAG